VRVEIQALPFGGELCVRGLALIDQRDQSSTPLLLTSRGHFRQVHSGDVKIYRALDSLPRAYVVHQARILENDVQAIEAMTAPSFAPSQVVLLHKTRADKPVPLPTTPILNESHVTILSYEPHAISFQAEMDQPGYVVLSDTWYPGWQASLDGQPVPIERANLAFRAIYVPRGSHTLHLAYRPASYVWGLRLSLGTLLLLAMGLAMSTWNAMRRSSSPRSASTSD
jgi:hypothetical protein